MPGETAVQKEKNRDESYAKKYSTNSLLQLSEFWKGDHIGLVNILLCPLQMWESEKFGKSSEVPDCILMAGEEKFYSKN